MADSVIEQSTKELIDSLKQSCGSFGLGNDGNEYKIIVQVFLYKYFNDKFGYEAKNIPNYGDRIKSADKWDAAYDKFTDEDVDELFAYLPSSTPRLRPHQTIAHLYNAMTQGDFSTLFDSTLREIAVLNADIFSIATDSKTKITVFDNSLIATTINDPTKRDEFARSLMRHIADPKANFEPMFSEKYDFFSTMFEHLIKDYNKDGGGKYAEYYTPRSIAQIMARLLVGRDADLRGVTCYDPSAGSGTLLMALAHQIGENRCSIYSQDISQKSSQMLRLNLILNNLAASIQNVVQGNTLLRPGHRNPDGSIRRFDFGISNPPFKLDFPEERDKIAEDSVRFWAGVPNAPAQINPDKPKMKIFLCFIQHLLYSLSEKGKGAIVVPTGFITAKTSIEGKILQYVVDKHIVYGCVSMPSNVFATTGTNVSVLFFDNSRKADKVVLIDASKLGEEYKDGNNQRKRLRDFEIQKIVDTFLDKKAEDGFSVVVSHDEIKAKGYTLSAGQYFDVKIEYVPITADEFKEKVSGFKSRLAELNAKGAELDRTIDEQLSKLHFVEKK
ncbi:MAG: SAM-dependent DNA methyltransferase [Kiritimatiellae bacterium]|nr:SAM-dependent DNA methyltransferase [Kiritimatiellia bacterium]